MHNLIRAELGDHHMLSLCPAHKIELAIRDAFEQLELNNSCNNYYTNIYYLFEKTNLWCRLFKRQAQFQGVNYIQYNNQVAQDGWSISVPPCNPTFIIYQFSLDFAIVK